MLRRELARLPRDYSEPVVLQIIGGYSGEEIADLLGLSVAGSQHASVSCTPATATCTGRRCR